MIMERRIPVAALAAVVLASACAAQEPAAEPVPTSAPASIPASVAATPSPQIGTWGVDLTTRDPNVKAGDDFNRFANGAWMDSYEMPPDLSSYGTFIQLRLDAESDVRDIVEELAAKEATPGSLEQKVGAAYGAWMDTERLNELGASPLKPHVDRIMGLSSRKQIQREMASLHADAPFGFGIIPDPADTTRYIAFVGQSGLGMPNRDYYLEDDARFKEYRAAYETYVTKMLELAGLSKPARRAQAIIALETKIAQVHWTPAESRDIKKIYNPMPLEQLAKLAPEFEWKMIVDALGLTEVPTFVVAQTTAIEKSGKIFSRTPVRTWQSYLAFHFIRSHAQYLSSDFDDAHFAFYSKTLRGIPEQRDRWKRGVNLINGALGEAVGQIYVKRHFPPSHKAQMEALVANLIAAFEERLKANPWMDEPTREQALLKLSTFEPRIGYPEKWTDYSDLSLEREALLANALAIDEFQWKDQVERLGGPVDRQRWGYPPQTVNASYNPLLNQITFPAGILQPPFFDPSADPAVNYGAIGAVIGHEIGHGFDDQGRRFDEKGRIRDWWTETSDKRFSVYTDRLDAQYSAFSPVEGLFVNGKLTMGENIGDIGGLQMAYAAFHRSLDACCGGEAPIVDGLTGDQRFFLGYAQVWRSMYREDELRQRVKTDPHSPPAFRVNGTVRNTDAWYTAFDVKEGDELYIPPDERVRIW